MTQITNGNYYSNLSQYSKNVFSYDFKGNNSSLKIGANTKLLGVKFVLGDDCEVIIGDGCLIRGKIISSHKGSRIIIGNKVKMNAECRVHAAEGRRIEIRGGCLLSNVRFRTSDSHSIIDISNSGVRLNPAADILIEENVWIAEDVNIYKGVTIGGGSVVGARSTVVRSLPSFSLCVGNPARVVKSNISWKESLI